MRRYEMASQTRAVKREIATTVRLSEYFKVEKKSWGAMLDWRERERERLDC